MPRTGKCARTVPGLVCANNLATKNRLVTPVRRQALGAAEINRGHPTLSAAAQKMLPVLTIAHLPRGAWRIVRGNSDRAQLFEAVRLQSRRPNGRTDHFHGFGR